MAFQNRNKRWGADPHFLPENNRPGSPHFLYHLPLLFFPAFPLKAFAFCLESMYLLLLAQTDSAPSAHRWTVVLTAPPPPKRPCPFLEVTASIHLGRVGVVFQHSGCLGAARRFFAPKDSDQCRCHSLHPHGEAQLPICPAANSPFSAS